MWLSANLSGVTAGFTTREPGVSRPPYTGANLGYHVGDDPEAVGRNRMALEKDVGPLLWMNQVHGNHIADGVNGTEADGLLLHPGQGGAVMVADCIPLLLYGEQAGQRLGAVVHAGRPGMCSGIAMRAVQAFEQAGIMSSHIHAVIGPHICGACYEVLQALAESVGSSVPHALCRTRWGSYGLDIGAGVAAQLAGPGVLHTAQLDGHLKAVSVQVIPVLHAP